MVYGPTSPQPHFHGTLEKDEASPDSRAHCTGCTPSFVPGDDDDDYNVISAGLGHMCPNPQNGLFQCF